MDFRLFVIVSILVLVLGAAPRAGATTFCVHDEAAFRTALATAASNGQDDAIHLVRGTYHTNGQAFDYEPAETNSLSIAGGFDGDCSSRHLNPALTVLDGGDASQVFVSQSRRGSVAIRYVTVQHGVGALYGGGLLFSYEANTPGDGDVTVSLDIIRDNRATYGAGLSAAAAGASVMRVKNNLFAGNVATSWPGGASVVANGDAQVYVTNNTVVANQAGDEEFAGGLYVNHAGSTPAAVSNNVLFGNSGYDLRCDSVPLLSNDWGSIDGAPMSGSLGNLSVDPQFVSATDFHLHASSPLIDAGVDDPPDDVTDTDLDGNSRVYGHVDIGAYEHGDAIFADGFE